jgi:threonine aldolase
MANLIACRLHTRPGEAVILDAACHILNAEGGGLAVHSGIVPKIVTGDRGRFTPEQAREQLTGPGYYRPHTTLLACEQTHNLGGGAVWPREQLEAVCAVAREAGMKTHLDGARLFNASVAAGVPPAAFAAPFDTVMVCLSKGLGAPAGALLAGPAEAILRARGLKQLFGGSMRQSGILAAAGLYALEHHVERLAEDHRNARRLAEGLTGLPGIMVEPVETNIVYVRVGRGDLTGQMLAERLRQDGVDVSVTTPTRLRFCTHMDVSASDIERAIETVARHLAPAART